MARDALAGPPVRPRRDRPDRKGLAMPDTARTSTQIAPEGMSQEEWDTRVDLAACYRLIAHFGMDDLIYNHASARVPGPEEHFLLNPFGLLYEEVTASSLVKVDLDG